MYKSTIVSFLYVQNHDSFVVQKPCFHGFIDSKRFGYTAFLELIWSGGTCKHVWRKGLNEVVQGPCAHLGFKCWDMGIVARAMTNVVLDD
jgi:hypothetical protein